MKPIDYRTDTWRSILARVDGLRAQVYTALRQHGPCTTRALATLSGIDLLTVRPRVTELCQLGLATCIDPSTPTASPAGCRGDVPAPVPARPHEGLYAAVPVDLARRNHILARAATRNPQLHLL